LSYADGYNFVQPLTRFYLRITEESFFLFLIAPKTTNANDGEFIFDAAYEYSALMAKTDS
jgi:hypothetical protein